MLQKIFQAVENPLFSLLTVLIVLQVQDATIMIMILINFHIITLWVKSGGKYKLTPDDTGSECNAMGVDREWRVGTGTTIL